jgi:hypothetical protein
MKIFIFVHFIYLGMFGGVAGELRPPNAPRRKRVPQTLDLTPFGDDLGDAAEML